MTASAAKTTPSGQSGSNTATTFSSRRQEGGQNTVDPMTGVRAGLVEW